VGSSIIPVETKGSEYRSILEGIYKNKVIPTEPMFIETFFNVIFFAALSTAMEIRG
jgi:hypothetical protein